MKTHHTKNPAIDPIVHLWLLRILMKLGGSREFIHSRGFNNNTLAEILGLEQCINSSGDEHDQKAIQTKLRQSLQQAEKKWSRLLPSAYLRINVGQLSGLVGLSETDCRILEFTILLHTERLLDDAADWIGELSSAKVFHALSVILNLPEAEIRTSLGARGILARSGLISISRSNTGYLRSKLELLSDGFADLMVSTESDPVSLLRGTVSAASPRQLRLADYSHIQNRAYRVSNEILAAWGDIGVKDGFIQRSVCPPWFTKPEQFLKWLDLQQVKLINNNWE